MIGSEFAEPFTLTIKGGDTLKLETLRVKAGWSQEFVARRLEVSRATIDNWEKGRTEPNLSTCVRIAALFGVKLEELLEVSK